MSMQRKCNLTMKRILVLACGFIFFFSANASGQDFKTNFTETSDTSTNTLLIPNAFTPNNDGYNDVFKIDNFTDQKLIEFKVFNRWGTILFQTTDPNVGWDGTYRGRQQPLGVYGYVIRIAYPNKVIETYKGTVTLLR